MRKVLAQGTFDIIHPGHLHYLEESKKHGDSLSVVITRDSRTEKNLFFDEDERKKIVESLEVVDNALKGSEDNIYDTVEKIDPDIITIGYDQEFDLEKVKKNAEEVANHKIEVVKITGKEGYSSSQIKNMNI